MYQKETVSAEWFAVNSLNINWCQNVMSHHETERIMECGVNAKQSECLQKRMIFTITWSYDSAVLAVRVNQFKVFIRINFKRNCEKNVFVFFTSRGKCLSLRRVWFTWSTKSQSRYIIKSYRLPFKNVLNWLFIEYCFSVNVLKSYLMMCFSLLVGKCSSQFLCAHVTSTDTFKKELCWMQVKTP